MGGSANHKEVLDDRVPNPNGAADARARESC
jgi:hypothetical protein